jgi:hypothetical protein
VPIVGKSGRVGEMPLPEVRGRESGRVLDVCH